MKILLLIWLFNYWGISSPTECPTYCDREIAEINAMPLKETILVAVDSLEQIMNQELILVDKIYQGRLLADCNLQGAELGRVYFDLNGNVRKTVGALRDGGSLMDVTYYDEDGSMIYTLYNSGESGYRLAYYNKENKSYIHTDWDRSDSVNDSLESTSPITVKEFAKRSKVRLELPSNCRTVCFSPLNKGDFCFLLTTTVYEKSAGKGLIFKDDDLIPDFGCIVQIVSIKGDWCQVLRPSLDQPMGYVRTCDLEHFFM